MATYAIGDIQGCFTSLMALLKRVAFDPAHDRLLILKKQRPPERHDKVLLVYAADRILQFGNLLIAGFAFSDEFLLGDCTGYA